METKAKKAAQEVRESLNHPLMPTAAKAALIGLAETVEALAHEVEILRIRVNRQAAFFQQPSFGEFRDENHDE